MKSKKVVLLKKIISNFATPTQLQRYDELVNINKGSSTHYALRLIERYFEKQQEEISPLRENSIKQTRTILINGYGQSWFQEI